ncbi:hypothetical protein PENTCL1PPCAC_19216, partial [Pristionchus entomophagus]
MTGPSLDSLAVVVAGGVRGRAGGEQVQTTLLERDAVVVGMDDPDLGAQLRRCLARPVAISLVFHLVLHCTIIVSSSSSKRERSLGDRRTVRPLLRRPIRVGRGHSGLARDVRLRHRRHTGHAHSSRKAGRRRAHGSPARRPPRRSRRSACKRSTWPATHESRRHEGRRRHTRHPWVRWKGRHSMHSERRHAGEGRRATRHSWHGRHRNAPRRSSSSSVHSGHHSSHTRRHAHHVHSGPLRRTAHVLELDSSGGVIGNALHAVDLDLGGVTADHSARDLVYRLLVNLHAMDRESGTREELLMAHMTLEVLGLLMLDENFVVLEVSVTVPAPGLLHLLLLTTHFVRRLRMGLP